MNGQVAALVAARNDAIARGDKALGREIYHQLQVMGVDPETIDSGSSEPVEAPAPEPIEAEVETAEPPELEQAVPTKPKRRSKPEH